MQYKLVESKRWGLKEVGSRPMNEGEEFTYDHIGNEEFEQISFATIKNGRVDRVRSFAETDEFLPPLEGEQVKKAKIRICSGF